MWICCPDAPLLWFLIGRKAIKRFTSIRLPQFRDQPQEVGKQISRDGDLGHLKCDVAAMADELRADFDELLFQGRQRPSLIESGVARVRRMKLTALQYAVRWPADRVFDPLGFEELVYFRIRETRVSPEINARDLPFLSFDNRLPPIGAVDIAGTQCAAFQIAELVEHEQRKISGAEWPFQLARRGRATRSRFAADDPAHRGIMPQALGVVHVRVSRETAKY